MKKKILYFIAFAILLGYGYGGYYNITMNEHKPKKTETAQEQNGGVKKSDAPQDAGGGKKDKKPQPPSVISDTARELVVPNQFQAAGIVVANQSIALKTRIDSQVQQIFVKDGAIVKKGDLIVQLDDAPIKTQIAQITSSLDKENFLLIDTKNKLDRSNNLLSQGFETKANNDSIKKIHDAQVALVKSIEAQMDALKLQLSYTKIQAPISGRVGNINISAGALVRIADANPILIINELSPIKIQFPIGQEYLSDVKNAIKNQSGEIIINAEGLKNPIKAKIATIDNAVDAQTGLFLVRAISPNSDESLWQGMSVVVNGQFNAQKYPMAVEETAIYRTNEGEFVYVITDNKVKLTKVVLGKNIKGKQVIASGISAQDVIVIDGLLTIRDGMAVNPKNKN